MPYITEKFTVGKDLNIKTPALPLHCGDNQRLIALHLADPHPTLQMTIALKDNLRQFFISSILNFESCGDVALHGIS